MRLQVTETPNSNRKSPLDKVTNKTNAFDEGEFEDYNVDVSKIDGVQNLPLGSNQNFSVAFTRFQPPRNQMAGEITNGAYDTFPTRRSSDLMPSKALMATATTHSTIPTTMTSTRAAGVWCPLPMR